MEMINICLENTCLTNISMHVFTMHQNLTCPMSSVYHINVSCGVIGLDERVNGFLHQ